MTAADCMQSEPHCCVPHQRLLDALEIMGEERMDWVAVVATGASRQWLGWVTAYDAAVFLGSFDKRPSQVMCREVMTSPPALLAPDMDVEQAYTAIRAACVQRLPVIQNGTFTGVVRLP